jgi:hypothetical protein
VRRLWREKAPFEKSNDATNDNGFPEASKRRFNDFTLIATRENIEMA